MIQKWGLPIYLACDTDRPAQVLEHVFSVTIWIKRGKETHPRFFEVVRADWNVVMNRKGVPLR